MTGAPLDARAAAAWSSSVDLPMPGSPPTSTAEPGTRPPPSTRSNSAMPVGSRGASRVSVPSPSKEAALPLPPLMATRAGGPAGAAVSSMMMCPLPAGRAFSGPAGAHRATGLADEGFGNFGHDELLAAGIAPRRARAEIGEDFVVDGAGMGGKFVRGDVRADQLDPGAGRASSRGTSVTSTVIRSMDTRPISGAGCDPK